MITIVLDQVFSAWNLSLVVDRVPGVGSASDVKLLPLVV